MDGWLLMLGIGLVGMLVGRGMGYNLGSSWNTWKELINIRMEGGMDSNGIPLFKQCLILFNKFI